MTTGVAEEVQKANGDAGEAAYWWMKMLTDPTQREARAARGYSADTVWNERDAFKHTFNLFRRIHE